MTGERWRIGRPGLIGAALLAGACAPMPGTAPAPLPAERPLPALPVAQAAPPPLVLPRVDADPLASLPPGELVTLTASDVDVRALLPALAEAAGVSMVLDDAVTGRVSVNLQGVPARDALRAVLDQAGLGVAGTPLQAPFPPTVFYTLPVDVNRASVELIRAQFGVSAEMAEWIVRTRNR